MAFRKTRQHKCACTHCTAQISTGLLMCPTYWFKLPARLRENITSAIADCKRAGIQHSDALITLQREAIHFHAKQPELLT